MANNQPRLPVRVNSVNPVRSATAPSAERRAIGGGLTKRVHRVRAGHMAGKVGGAGAQS